MPVNFSENIYPSIYFYSHNYYNKTDNQIKTMKILEYKKCNELFKPENKDKEFNNFKLSNDWICLDFGSLDIILDSYSDETFYNHFEINLSTCNIPFFLEKDNEKIDLNYRNNFNYTSKKCSNFTNLKDFLYESKYISIINPEVINTFSDLQSPFNIIYKNPVNEISINLLKNEKFIMT